LRVSKGYGASRLCKLFLERHYNTLMVEKTLLEKLMLVEVSTDNQVVVACAMHVRLTTCISEVEDLVLSQEDNQACVRENGGHFEHRL